MNKLRTAYTILSFIIFFSVCLVLIGSVNKTEASHKPVSYEQRSPFLTGGLSGANCPGAASDWVAVRVYLKDTVTHNNINGTFTVKCKSNYQSGGLFYEGPHSDGQHTIARAGYRCPGETTKNDGEAACMGSCTLPFYLSAKAPNYHDTPQWLVNHESSLDDTLYDEGNLNTANYNIYMDKVELPPPPPPPSSPEPPETDPNTVPPCGDIPRKYTFFWITTTSGTTNREELRLFKPDGSTATRVFDPVNYPAGTAGRSYEAQTLIPPNQPGWSWGVRDRLTNGTWTDWNIKGIEKTTCTKPDLTVSTLKTLNADGVTPQSAFAPGNVVKVDMQIKNISTQAAQNPPASIINIWDRDDLGGESTAALDTSWEGGECVPQFFHGTSWTNQTPFASNATSSPSGNPLSFTIPTSTLDGTYRIRVMTDFFCSVDERSEGYFVDENNLAEITFAVSQTPPQPRDLTPTLSCIGLSSPQVVFSWTDLSALETSFELQVNVVPWTGDPGPAPYYTQTLAANTTSYTWNATTKIGNSLNPVPGNTYWWRMRALRTNHPSSAYMYPTNSLLPEGVPLTTFDCRPNLRVTSLLIPDGTPGQTVSTGTYVTIANTGSYKTPDSVNFTLRIHNNKAALPGQVYDCTTASAYHATFNETQLLAGEGRTHQNFSFQLAPVPAGPKTAVALVDSTGSAPNCTIQEISETDNTLTDTYVTNGIDLAITIDSLSPASANSVYPSGQLVNANLTLTNTNATGQSVTGTINIGAWPDSSGVTDCAASFVGTPPRSTSLTLNGFPAGASAPVTITNIPLPSGDGQYTLRVYAPYNCNPANDVDWTNNVAAKTYIIRTDAWFETQGGDVGSGGDISINLSPLPTCTVSTNGYNPNCQSTYLLAAGGSLTNVSSQHDWEISTYTEPLVSGEVYSGLKERFRDKMTTDNCGLDTNATQRNYCTTSVTWTGAGSVLGSSAVWFIDGDLNINTNRVIPVNSAAHVFVVSGNINVATNVTRIDGVFVAGGVFSSVTDPSNTLGNQLKINGAVYASLVDFRRKLSASGATCDGAACTNATHPAEKVVWDPKYLAQMSSIIGFPEVTWTEVAP